MNEPLTQSALATARGEIAQLGKENHRLKSLFKRENSTDWQLGGIAMLRSMKATLQLLREGKWTLDDADKWVDKQLE